MDPAYMFENLDPANQFAMEYFNMACAAELIRDGTPLPKGLFLDIMTVKNPNVGGSYQTFASRFGISGKHW